MAVSRIGAAGIPLNNNALIPPSNYFPSAQVFAQFAGNNEMTMPAGAVSILPAGQYQVTPGLYTFIQTKDPVTNLWRQIQSMPNGSVRVYSDGGNFRLANLTGCALGAVVTTAGTAYTSAPTVTASAGASTWTAIVGGAISATVGAGALAGTGYIYPPILQVSAPPLGGVPATLTCAISAGAISAVTVVNQGAGYNVAPTVSVVNDPRDTVGSGGTIVAALAGSGTITAVVCTNHGTPVTAVPTLTFSGGGGSSGAATAVMCFSITGVGSVTGGAGYGNALAFGVITTGGQAPAGTGTNPANAANLLIPRQASGAGVSTSGGALTATGFAFTDTGLFSAVPSTLVIGSAIATGQGAVPVTVGGVTDSVFIQPV